MGKYGETVCILDFFRHGFAYEWRPAFFRRAHRRRRVSRAAAVIFNDKSRPPWRHFTMKLDVRRISYIMGWRQFCVVAILLLLEHLFELCNTSEESFPFMLNESLIR